MKQRLMRMFSILLMAAAMLVAIVPQAAVASSALADGEYTVPLEVLKAESNDISAAGDYIASPAKLVIEQGNMYAVLTLNNRSWWQSFQTQAAKSGGFSDVTLVSDDEANDTRVVKFEVQDANEPVRAKIHIIVTGIPGFEYDNKYDIRLKFDVGGIPAAPNKPAVSSEPQEHADVVEPVQSPGASGESDGETNTDSTTETREAAETPDTAEIDTEQAAAIEDEVPVHDGDTEPSGEAIDAETAVQTEGQPSGDTEAEQAENDNASGRTNIILLSIAVIGAVILLVLIFKARIVKK